MSKGTFPHLLQVPQILPGARSFSGLRLAHQAVSRTWKGELRIIPLLFRDIVVGASLNFGTWTKANPSAETTFPCKS